MVGGIVASALELLLKLRNAGVDALLEVDEGFGYCTVEGYHRAGTVGLATHGTELEAVAGEGEGRSAVAVGVVNQQFGNLRDVHLEMAFAIHQQSAAYGPLGGFCGFVCRN